MARWLCLMAVATVRCSAAMSDGGGFLVSSAERENATLITRDGNSFNPVDLSFITKMAAIGDSYSAGIGAGQKLGSTVQFLDPDSDYACSRYDHAYPYLVNYDERLGDSSKRKFQFKSCSGAVIGDVLRRQVPALGSGGNDIELTNILNQCIFQWAVLKPIQVTQAKTIVEVDKAYDFLKFLDFSVYSRGCEGQMDVSQALIDGPAFSSSLDSIITAAKAKLGPGGKLYYTGYAKFWAADLSLACDNVSWGTWLHKAENVWEPYQRLTSSHRKRMNALVDAVNDKLSDAVARAGPNVIFVDYDEYLTKAKGHFCEAGVDETPTNGETWNDNLFYKMDSGIQGSSPWKRDSTGVLTGTFKGSMEVLTQLTLMLDPASKLLVEGAVNKANSASIMDEGENLSGVGELLKDYFPNFLPDGYGRVFHPQEILHEIIAEVVIQEMGTSNLLSNGFPAILDDPGSDSCSYNPSNPSGGGQQIALASYTNPLGDPAAWERLISYDSGKLSILVANVLNGPDYVVDASWSSVIQKATNSGKTIIGYVRTGYLGVSTHKFKTRLGSDDLADWASQIEQDVDKWYELYPGGIGGIFFDEGWPECGPDNIYSDFYAHINAYTKRQHPGAYTVLNPGSPMAQCFENTMDTLLTFENSYEAYKTIFTENDWTPKDDRKIWHIVYDVPQDKIEEVAALALSRHAGYLEMTDDVNPPNPYDNVPNDAYMQTAMNIVAGGKVRKDAAVALKGSYVTGPPDANVIASDYTSVTITWSPVANALGYAVYQNGKLVLEMPAFLTRATVGMLKPGTVGISFEVKTILSSGSGGTSKLLTASTNSLPSGSSITNVLHTKSGDKVIYTADVLVPYAFVRLFIGGPHKAVGPSVGWPIDAGMSIPDLLDDISTHPQHKLFSYMIEGNDFYSPFYSYAGSYVELGTANADWSWTQLGVAPQFQSGYTYTWTVPLGGTDALPDDWAVQGQGYAPLQNVFGGSLRSYKCDGQPCDDNPAYNCKGSSMCTTPNMLSWCDRAVNNLIRTDDLTYGTSGDVKNGGCAGDGTRFCGVFLQGNNCAMSGNNMWKNYQNLRKFGGCSRCGSYKLPDGCLLTVNYVSSCDNTAGAAGLKIVDSAF